MVTGVVPSPPRFLPSIFIAHRVQQSHCSSIFHRVLLTHALALSASQFVHKKKSPRFCTSMHSGGFEVTKLSYTRLENNLIRHRGDRSASQFVHKRKSPRIYTSPHSWGFNQYRCVSVPLYYHEEQKRDHLGTLAIDVHRMFHHDSTALTTRASGLGWTSAGLPHTQGVHRNLRTNPVDPGSPLQTLTHTITCMNCIMHIAFHRCLVLSPLMWVIHFTYAEQG